ncbi:hypothetical protein EV05_1389 [Prochlorococcus sp. MIT 0601]|nr:hypothetical protein EV05_1389 [Prochlorococcus sp. MIT 0601]
MDGIVKGLYLVNLYLLLLIRKARVLRSSIRRPQLAKEIKRLVFMEF